MQEATLIQQFKDFYSDFSNQPLSLIDQLYDPKVRFLDPIHEVDGRDQLKQYFSSVGADLVHCHFNFLDQIVDEKKAYFTWEMDYAHPRIKNGTILRLSGVTRIGFADQILYHEDYYDMGAMLYRHLPLLGWTVRALNQRLAS
ncbi:nuclear transport factor 2 family protein [Aestuariirhabdus sp. Z084]|uniref:nuclear transport factor 2 family protein n=1 Tax=Aestuariirhabdus haliotis TaxID=2918751 RepID=UPI00201B360A|nr:nuclear transport factor 2 family protein [Aestuariirhabdus haliotis]MCL6416042.1 nuclear transport factor 2 family protein [Aestuariirhabdus haliotis]MCL6419390.1 nuclear transport factor 2 family protein [Aestuariirhabdus haliotis]